MEVKINRLNKDTEKNPYEKLLTTNKRIKFYTGLPSIAVFNLLYQYEMPKEPFIIGEVLAPFQMQLQNPPEKS